MYKLKSGIKKGDKVTLKISPNVVGNSNDQNNFAHKSLSTNTHSSAIIKLSKTQLHRVGQSGGFLDSLSEPLLKTGLPLIENVLKPLAKSVLIPLG